MSSSTTPATPASTGRRGPWLTRGLSLLGVASLCFILGAAVIYFELPTSKFLRLGFAGAVAWYETRPEPAETGKTAPPNVGSIDHPAKTCDGFTLCMYGKGSQAVLINMRGEVVHRWHVPFSRLWPAPTHVPGRIDDATVYFNDGHLYPNGDLVVVVEGPITTANPSNGFGLVKLDKDSNVLWKYAEKCHHDVDVGEDGRIYVLTNEMVDRVPAGLAHIPTPCMVDFVDVLSAQGERLKRLPILEAIHESPYAPLLGVLDRPHSLAAGSPGSLPPFRDEQLRRDVLHTNSVKVLSSRLAPRFPLFKPGQILISPRNLDAIAVLDPDSGKIVWATRGPWHSQHDPTFLESGRILLFDNLGSPRTSRVLELDLRDQSFPWSYPGDRDAPFVSPIRGMCQRLRNGNTLVVSSVEGKVLEVTAEREIVWTCSTSPVTLNRARRYDPEELSFLKGVKHARP
jgi:hypothetical protein